MNGMAILAGDVARPGDRRGDGAHVKDDEILLACARRMGLETCVENRSGEIIVWYRAEGERGFHCVWNPIALRAQAMDLVICGQMSLRCHSFNTQPTWSAECRPDRSGNTHLVMHGNPLRAIATSAACWQIAREL